MGTKSIFNKRVNILPYDYPNLLKYKDAIRHSYWIDTEYNFTTDINDFKVNITDNEREIIKKTMLAIAQVEVNVKTFWADMYKRMPITEIGDVGMTFAECHIEGTEILTPKGWVDFRDINVGDKVMQYNPQTKTMSITEVNHKISDDYEGDMYKFTKKKLEAVVTPNHRIIYFTKRGNFVEKFAKEINIHSDCKIPEAAKLENKEGLTKLSWMDKLKIAIQADGTAKYYIKDGERIRRGLDKNTHTYEIAFKKERKKKRFLEILSNVNVDYREYKDSRDGYVKYDVDLDMDYDYKTFDWVNLNDKSWEWCEDFVQELSKWDGYVLENKKDCKIKYSSTNKSCADVAQLVGIGAGYKCNLNTYKDNRKESYKDVYTVSFISNRELVGTNTAKETIPYKGKVYCVNVDSGVIITRYKDTTFISGNSEVRHKDAYARLLRILGLEDEFRTVVEIPAIKDRIEYLTKYLDGTRSRDDKMYTKSVLLFSLFIEHVSLFSQFLIMMSFNKEKNLFKGISNVVEATSKEEDIHGNFGSEIINIIKSENPEWFDDEFNDLIYSACKKAYKAECKILDWIFETGELEFLPKEVIKQFIMNRFNNSLERIGMERFFEVDRTLLESVKWFDVELTSSKEGDFFYKRLPDYTKKQKAITEDDLF
jgi:ribonucleotide reductase beta subunit family protein with ferritin-like domain